MRKRSKGKTWWEKDQRQREKDHKAIKGKDMMIKWSKENNMVMKKQSKTKVWWESDQKQRYDDKTIKIKWDGD
jgi:hypothetical protein